MTVKRADDPTLTPEERILADALIKVLLDGGVITMRMPTPDTMQWRDIKTDDQGVQTE